MSQHLSVLLGSEAQLVPKDQNSTPVWLVRLVPWRVKEDGGIECKAPGPVFTHRTTRRVPEKKRMTL